MTHAAGLQSQTVYGWLIERDGPTYYQIPSQCGDSQWTTDSVAALRFARRQDAEAFASAILQSTYTDLRVVEHGWG